ncbi:hypothetical protein LCGC14_1659990 [marine sediment metagenome]|uniref:Uncharacterized protein n=1 Tax=marine sediment metagenome TaxID=412755 RepID=A0A0F9HV60_9ZZZZ
MFRKKCFRCGTKGKKPQLHNLKKYRGKLTGYVCPVCFDIIDIQLNLTGNHPETPPQ